MITLQADDLKVAQTMTTLLADDLAVAPTMSDHFKGFPTEVINSVYFLKCTALYSGTLLLFPLH